MVVVGPVPQTLKKLELVLSNILYTHRGAGEGSRKPWGVWGVVAQKKQIPSALCAPGETKYGGL